jgi:hypothetical protein
MSDNTLYFAALSRLSSVTSGSTDFEKIGRVLIKAMSPDYSFKTPEGGHGTKDGGYDGYDPLKQAKLACSLEKDYKDKIYSEVEKSRKNGDVQLFYFSNQVIPEDEKNKIKADPNNHSVDLFIFGIDDLSREIELHFKNQNDVELYDLLEISSLKIGEQYSRGDAQKIQIYYDGILYPRNS